jgi:hypothetical protein
LPQVIALIGCVRDRSSSLLARFLPAHFPDRDRGRGAAHRPEGDEQNPLKPSSTEAVFQHRNLPRLFW